jgi:hypothetical protein
MFTAVETVKTRKLEWEKSWPGWTATSFTLLVWRATRRRVPMP